MENHLHESQLKKLKELINDVKMAMLCTIQNGCLQSRPMATSKVDEQGNIWFFTNEYSGKIDQVQHDPHVCLSYSNPSKNTYLSITGEAELINNWAKIKELYNPTIKAWFPKGLDDPQLALLKVTTRQAEYWDTSASKMITFFNIIRSVVSGDKFNEGEHGKIDL